MSTASGERILCINGGSSSLKLACFEVVGDTLRRFATGAVERVALPGGRAWVRLEGDRTRERAGSVSDAAAALDVAFSLMAEAGVAPVTRVGHRLVHGGTRYVRPVRIDEAVIAGLKELVPLAPLHLPAAIAAIEAVSARLPGTPQVACFDTAFHAAMPEPARRLPLPARFDRIGIRRYGFHGLSYESVMATLGPAAPSRIVIAHLGNGSSLVAVRDGVAVDTTMGLTPAGGILMGTRTGDLDPGVLVHLMRTQGMSVEAVERLVDREAGLLAIGGTSDMKDLLARAASSPEASLAVSMFGYAVAKAIGAFVAVLGGIDLLVFTGGIGEHAAEVRRMACQGLHSMGIVLDAERNGRGEPCIGAPTSGAAIRIVPAQEELVIARHVLAAVPA